MSEYTNINTVQFGSGSNESSFSSRGHQSFNGGVSTYSIPVADTPPLMNSGNIQHNVGSVITVGSNGSSRSDGIQTISTAELNPGQGNFLDTARNSGMPAMGNLTPETVVNFNGMEVKLETLESMGEVKRTATGYEIPGQDRAFQKQQPQTQISQQSLGDGPTATVELFAPEVENSIAQAIDPIPQAFYDSALASAIENGVDGINFNELAFHSGLTSDQVRETAQLLSSAFTKQADNVATASGIENPAEVWDWASTERKEQFMDAKRQLAIGRNPAALKALVNEYYANVPPTIEALQNAGIQVRTDYRGETVAFIRGNWITPAAAARAGLI